MDPKYPTAPHLSLTEKLHGVEVPDPFRPLEELDAPATAHWLAEEQSLTSAHLSSISCREAIRTRIAELWDHPKQGAPFERGGRWFQLRNSGLQAQPVVYVGDDPADISRILIDANELSLDGTVSLSRLSVSDDGSYLAWSTSKDGSDWQTWRVRSVDTGDDLADRLEWSKFSDAAWSGNGFYYTAFDPPAAGGELTAPVAVPRIAYHALGDPQEADRVQYCAPDEPDWLPHASTSDDGRYLVITLTRGTGTETHVLVGDLHEDGSPLQALNDRFSAKDQVVERVGAGEFLVLTDRSAERGRVVRARLGEDPGAWDEIVPESADTLLDARLIGGVVVAHYLHHATSVLRVFELDGTTAGDIEMPGPATIVEITGRPGSSVMHLLVMSYTQSGALWAHDLDEGTTRSVAPTTAPIDPARFVTEQVFVESLDGTPVPMFLTYASDARPDGDRPVLLYGYGGFDVALTPTFSVTFAGWLDRGGVLAVANLRGGGEYGRSWHEAGRLSKKQNVFDDFASCARWLVASGWARPSRIAVMGGSNGGLLVGATLTQHPELVGAALVEVGVLDMLRFHLFTIGWAWKSDYGDPDDPVAFGWLHAYSPLHNVREGRCYPATLIMTGDHDDRVVPAHSFKFAARLQQAQSCDRPILLRVTSSGGHGAGKPTAMLIDEAADRLAFLEDALAEGTA